MEKARILIVEDEAIIAMEIENQLLSLGYEVTSIVDTGEKAIEKAEEDKPDLMLMDIRIKGEMDGIDTAELIRSNFKIPVIFSTAHLDEEKVERAKQTLPFGYLLKPIRDGELKVSIRMALYAASVEKDRRCAEKKLMEKEAKYHELFSGMSSGVAVYKAIDDGKDFEFIDLNKSGEKIDQVYRDQVIGKSVQQIFPGIVDFGLFKVLQSVWKTGQSEFLPAALYSDSRLLMWRENFVYKLPTGEIISIYDDITLRKKAEGILKQKNGDLNERVKELNCIYSISNLFQKTTLQLSEIFQEVVNLIPSGWQFPNNACSRFVCEDNIFRSTGFKESKWRQSVKVIVYEKEFGQLDVFYLREEAEADEGPFLKEEKLLLNSVAERLGKTIERYQAEENLKNANRKLKQLSDRLEEENIYLQEEIKLTYHFDKIVSKNRKFLNILKMAAKVAESQTSVLITGETGTGKEMIARIIHELSAQKERPLVKVNCAALPANLIESELFGYQKGAFTGAVTDKKGRFEIAQNSTIFLDEIGDLPLDLQAKLLRVLQEGEFERLGGVNTIKVNVRVLAATNRDLMQLCDEGLFRLDLFYRLNVFPLESPPLRDRKEDIPLLVNHFINKFNKKLNKKIESISKSNLHKLKDYYWPGNIRELENIIERSAILSSGSHLELGDGFTESIQKHKQTAVLTLDDAQKKHIVHVLELTDGKIGGENGAAKILGLNRSTLQFRMKKLGVKVHRTTANI